MLLPTCALIVVAIVVCSLRVRGRPWHRNNYSQRWIDGWAGTHYGHGLVLYGLVKMLFPLEPVDLLSIVIMAEACWESFENRNWVINYFRGAGDKNYYGDSLANSGVDLLACILGAITMTFLI